MSHCVSFIKKQTKHIDELMRTLVLISAAYLSPDTLVIRESGNVSFKAIPEEKPLEVIFMAPELQKKGELSEKVCFLLHKRHK